MTTIMDAVENRIQVEAQARAHEDARAFEADIRNLLLRHGLRDGLLTDGAALTSVRAFTNARTAQLVERGRDAVAQRLFAGVEIAAEEGR